MHQYISGILQCRSTGNGCTTRTDEPNSSLMACIIFSKWPKKRFIFVHVSNAVMRRTTLPGGFFIVTCFMCNYFIWTEHSQRGVMMGRWQRRACHCRLGCGPSLCTYYNGRGWWRRVHKRCPYWWSWLEYQGHLIT